MLSTFTERFEIIKPMKKTILLFAIIPLLSLVSCHKETVTKGVVTVYDINGIPVPGAIVTLSQEDMGAGVNQTHLTDVKTTDFLGQTEHVLELEAIMNIDAVLYIDNTVDTMYYGTSTIRLTRGKTVYKDLEVTPYF